MAHRKRKISMTRRLHRSFGVFAAVFVLLMVVSGITINHSNDLGLDQRPVSQPLLLDWYGLEEPAFIYSFATGTNWVSFAGSQLYLDGESVSAISNGIGAIASGELLIAAGSDELLLLDTDGRLVERVAWAGADAGPVEAIGSLPNGGVAVKSMQQVWLSNSDLINWQKLKDTSMHPQWSFSTPAPEEIQQAIKQHYRGDKLNLEQLLLDLHSGRIFGSMGILIYDLLALALGFLAISGMILWLRGRRNGKRN